MKHSVGPQGNRNKLFFCRLAQSVLRRLERERGLVSKAKRYKRGTLPFVTRLQRDRYRCRQAAAH
jgi:hypothetical protein